MRCRVCGGASPWWRERGLDLAVSVMHWAAGRWRWLAGKAAAVAWLLSTRGHVCP